LTAPTREQRDDVARRVSEPGDHRSNTAVDALVIGAVLAVIMLEPYAAVGELIHGASHVHDREVEDRKICRRGVVLRIRQDGAASAEVKLQHPVRLGDVEAERIAVDSPSCRVRCRRFAPRWDDEDRVGIEPEVGPRVGVAEHVDGRTDRIEAGT
jgi:hypothetical protein